MWDFNCVCVQCRLIRRLYVCQLQVCVGLCIQAGAEVCFHSCIRLSQCVYVCVCLGVGGLMCAGYVLNEEKPAGAI